MSKHEMQLMDLSGHTSLSWDPAVESEVAIARAAFDDARERGMEAFHIGAGGRQTERMRTFDPNAEKMVIIPKIAGG
jgi:hypothetical protein